YQHHWTGEPTGRRLRPKSSTRQRGRQYPVRAPWDPRTVLGCVAVHQESARCAPARERRSRLPHLRSVPLPNPAAVRDRYHGHLPILTAMKDSKHNADNTYLRTVLLLRQVDVSTYVEVDIRAPAQVIWGYLTDERMGKYCPITFCLETGKWGEVG